MDTEENKEKEKQDKTDSWNAGSRKIIFDLMIEEYREERARNGSLDSKSGVFIAAGIAIIAILVPALPYDDVVRRIIEDGFDIILFIFLETLLLSGVLMAIAFYNLYKAITIRKYGRPDIKKFEQMKNTDKKEDIIFHDLIEYYYKITDADEKINEDKARRVKSGIFFTILSFALMLISVIGLNFIVYVF